MKIALLGGAFDPPHNGHVIMAECVSHTFDEVWLMPCYRHMYGKDMSPNSIRVDMCFAATAHHPKLKVFGYEIQHQLSGSTYETLAKLLTDPLHDHRNFSMVIGMDNALTFDKWKNADKLKTLIPFVVVPRQGYEHQPGWYDHSPHVCLTDNATPLLSSTDIRRWCKEGNDQMLDAHLPLPVLEVIWDLGLYGYPTKRFNPPTFLL
jgi:nicotinate-nucleotide adenylyltransferase